MNKETGIIDLQIEIDENTMTVAKREIHVKNVGGVIFLAIMFETIMDVVVDQNLDIALVEKVFEYALDGVAERQKEKNYDQYPA